MSRFNLNVKPFIHNRYVLYGVSLLALISIIGYANCTDYNSIFTLLIIGFITSFFSKNMVVILSVSIVLTYILKQDNKSINYSEGMEGTNKSEEDKEEDTEEDKVEDKVEDTEEIPPDAKKDLKELQALQKDIIDGFSQIEPMLNKAETFVERFKDKYSTKQSALKK